MKNILPVMLLKGLLVLPNQEVKIDLNNEISKKIINLSDTQFKKEIVIINPENQIEENPDINDLPNVGVVAKVKSIISLPNENLRVTLRGLFRIKITNFKNDKKDKEILECSYQKLDVPPFDKVTSGAYKRKLTSLFKNYTKNGKGISNSIVNDIGNIKDLNKLTDIISAFMPLNFTDKLELVKEINPIIRAEKLMELLNIEIEAIKIDKKIEEKMRISLENGQREYILKEKLKEIQEELGENNFKELEVLKYMETLENLKLNNENTITKIKREIKKFEYTVDVSPELGNIRNYLDWILNLPWGMYSTDNADLEDIRIALDKNHYGMEEAKSRILEYIAAKNRNPEIFSPIICLIGPAGVGKTTFAKSIADSLNRQFAKINVGGLNDSAILNGHKRTYLGSSPGKIIEALKRCQVSNPVILIDEVDKMVNDNHGDPAGVLLDILDKSQNNNFIDNYLEEPYDLSQVLFILTANNIYDIPYELLDRLEIVNLYSYTINEKIEIAKKYLVPKILKEHNILAKNFKISDLILKELIENYTNEAGVRELERVITTVIRKLIMNNNIDNPKITKELILELLGPSKYFKDTISKHDQVGVVNTLAVTADGGVVSELESIYYEGSGNIIITGNLEKIMQESVEVVVSYIKNNREIFKINSSILTSKDIHLHFLDATSKKDGPSAGIAIATAILSLVLNHKVKKNIAFTGEITLTGNIKKVGGLKEKIISAYNEGINKVYIPNANHNDLKVIDEGILKKIEIIEVDNYLEIFNDLFK